MSQSREVAAASAARDLAVAAARGESLAPLLPVVVEVLRADAGVGLTRLRRTAQGVDVTVQVAGSAPITAEMGRLAAEVADQHPAIPLLSTSGAVRVSDLVPIRDFWHTEVYARMHGHVGGRYPVAVMLHRLPDRRRVPRCTPGRCRLQDGGPAPAGGDPAPAGGGTGLPGRARRDDGGAAR